ncbi:MAG: right-handed parallel beta-helix repeat-containing protein [Clostridia bacterium]|nr:right-handed parallel beta-helix repeat-containing protein [Clostridia bacterium]
MKTMKSTKRSLLISALSLFLCVAMLAGTTFAWFTDSVSSKNNIITSGNLDVELYWSTDAKNWDKVDENDEIFKDETLWEPGHTEVVYLKVENKGSLSLKYRLGVNIVSEDSGINAAGDVFFLSDYIQMGVDFQGAENKGPFADRKAAIAKVESAATKISAGYSKSSVLYSANNAEKRTSAEYAALVVYMPETVGNVANHQTGTNPPAIQLGLDVFATQYTYEEDSFGADYDAGAPWVGEADTTWYDASKDEFTLSTGAQLAGLAEIVNAGDSFEKKTVKLDADIDLNNVNWTPIGTKAAPFKGTFLGQGHTVYNLKSVGEKRVGLIGATWVGAHIEGVNVVNAYVSGNDYVGVIVGGGYLAANCIKGCSVTNATVIAMPYLMANGEYDGGAKAGAIVGQAYNGSLIGNTVKNVNIMAYRDLGGIAGMLAFDGPNGAVEASGNTVESVSLSYVGVAGKYADNTPNQNMGDIVGRVGNKTVVANDNKGEAVKNEKDLGAIMIFTLDELINFAKEVNGGNTYVGKTVILGADIDLLNMEWTPINGFQGTFDGNEKVISNLKITGNKSDVGFFGKVNAVEIRNLTVHNATVSGRLDVGVVAGHPWTAKFTNIAVTGHVEVNGFAYVGGVGGKNAYANWTNVTVDVDDTSYVKAISTENGKKYRSYVGGVVGFNGEGAHTFKNITTNIDVIGDVCDIGGAFGIGHYENKFENVTVTGNVTCTGNADEIGGILGVWHNQDGTSVHLTNCKFTGKITAADGAVTDCDLVGGAYTTTGTGVLVIDGKDAEGNWAVTDTASLESAISKGGDVKVYNDVKTSETITIAEGADVTIDLNGKTVSGNKAKNNGAVLVNNGTLTITGGTIANKTTNGASVIENKGTMTLDGAIVEGAPMNQSGYPAYAILSYGKLTIEEGTKILANRGGISTCNETGVDYGKTEVVINGGSVVVSNAADGRNMTLHTIYAYGKNTELTINGGYFEMGHTSTGGASVICPAGAKINIYGGDFRDAMDDDTWTSTGNFQNYMGYNVALNVQGGTYDDKTVAKNLASGYEVVEANGLYYVAAKGTAKAAASAEEMADAIEAGADTVILPAGDYVIPAAAKGKTLKIIGNGEDTKVAVKKVGTGGENCDYGLDGSTVVFEDLTITTNSSTYIGYARCNATYNNCIINGTYTLYGNSVFNGCTFNVSGDVYNIWTWGAPNATFNNCTFNSDGKALLLYGTANTNLTVNNCVFNDNGGLTDLKAAIEIGNDYGKSYTLTVNNTTVNGYEINDKGINTGSTLWANKNSMGTDKLNVVIDGVDVY